jgi:hypothetical protein
MLLKESRLVVWAKSTFWEPIKLAPRSYYLIYETMRTLGLQAPTQVEYTGFRALIYRQAKI